MLSDFPFNPQATKVASGSTSSASVTLDTSTSSVRVFNASSAVAYVRFTAGASTAVATDTPVGTGQTAIFSKTPSDKVCSVLLSTGTGNVHFTAGEGR